ncbi:hypothetical protein ACFVSS_08070 [Peribacillus butanolivorans]|uniref:hypothetical protein n=1 Tax=Peribacillus butanolivorans TaxID=421767 RepID=UPI00366D523A
MEVIQRNNFSSSLGILIVPGCFLFLALKSNLLTYINHRVSPIMVQEVIKIIKQLMAEGTTMLLVEKNFAWRWSLLIIFIF